MADSVYLIGNFKAPDKTTIINGSYEVDRDFANLSAEINDPNGNREYALACRYHYVETRMCQCNRHRGERWIPATEFIGVDVICSGCQRELRSELHETERSMRQKPPQFWKRLRESHT